MLRIAPRSFSLPISSLLLALVMLLLSCNLLSSAPTSTPTASLPEPTEALPDPTATAALAQTPAESTGGGEPEVTMEISGLAQGSTLEILPAVAPDGTDDWIEVMPQHTLLTLQGYPVTGHQVQPQIFVYPVKELNINKNAEMNAMDLQTLLQTQQPGDQMPYLPLQFSVKQAIRAQVKYMDFKSGKGVRFLTEWHNGMAPINNHGLIYAFQGLTADGNYYVAAELPVNLEGLPVDVNDTSRLPAEFQSNYLQYLADTASLLDQNPDGAFTPFLSQLDALVGSIEVK